MIGRGFVRVTQQGTMREILTHPDFFGEESLLNDGPSKVSVATVTLCQFMVLDRAEFDDFQDLYPQMKKSLRRYASNKARQGKGALAGMAMAVKRIKVEFENRTCCRARDLRAARHRHGAVDPQRMRASLPQKGSQSSRGSRAAPSAAAGPM